jgi:hypothetical protein
MVVQQLETGVSDDGSRERNGEMEKHIQLVGILNLVYRSLAILGALVLFVLAAGFEGFFDYLVRWGSIQPHEVPLEVLHIVPFILTLVGIIVLIVSVLGIIGALGVLKKKEWGRILLLVISFFSLIRIPLGTLLGIYSIWVLLNSETIKVFNPVHQAPMSPA